MRLKAFAVIDTNVLVSSIYSESGFSVDLLKLVLNIQKRAQKRALFCS